MPLRSVNLHSQQVRNDLDRLRLEGGAHVLSVAFHQFGEKEPQILELYCPTHSQDGGFDIECSWAPASPLPHVLPLSPSSQTSGEGRVIYQTGSVTKLGIIATIFSLIRFPVDSDPDNAFTLDDLAFTLYYNWHRKRYPSAPVKKLILSTNPSIRSMLLHLNSFADLNDFFIAPDGKFILPQEHFLEVAVKLTDSQPENERRGYVVYSNANYIFLGMLIEVMTGRPLAVALKERVFDRLGMYDTSMDLEYLKRLRATVPFAVGHLVASNGAQRTTPFDHLLSNSVQSASMGLRSCVRDLTIFAQEILLASRGAGKIFSKEDASLLLRGQPYTMLGCFTRLNDGPIESESHVLNICPDLNVFRSEQRITGTRTIYDATLKAGYVDGFSSCVVILPIQMASLVVLSDSLGCLDTPDVVIRYLLQKLLPLPHPENIMNAVFEAKKVVEMTLAKLEKTSSIEENTYPLATDIAGIYQHSNSQQKIAVSNEGTARIYFKEDVQSRAMHIVYINEKTVRILTGLPLCLERWARWKKVDFTLCRARDDCYLMRGQNKYQKLEE